MSTGPDHVLARMQLPGSATQLALVRFAVGSFLCTVFTSRAIPLLLQIPGQVYPGTRSALPSWLEQWSAETALTLLGAGLWGSVAVALGLLTRVALPIVLVCYLLTQNVYYRLLTAHDDWLYFSFFLLVLAFAPCADRLSVDSLLRPKPARAATAYRWPVELMVVWIAIIYAAAGIAKLMPLRKGLVWLNGASMQGMAYTLVHDSPFYWFFGHAAFDYSQRWVFQLMSLGGALIELSALALLWSSRAYPWVFAAICGLHSFVFLFGIQGFLSIFLVAALALLPAHWFRDARP